MRHFGCDYFGFGPFGPHIDPPRHGFEDFCGPWNRRPRSPVRDYGPCGRSHGPPHGPFGPEHGPHRRPHFGPDGDGEFGPCGRGHGPHRGPFGCGHHKQPHFGPERDSDEEHGPSVFGNCGRRHGPPRCPFGPEHGPPKRSHCGPGGDDEFGCGPCGRRHGPPRGPHGPRHGPHKRPHFGDGDSDAECGPGFGPCNRRRPYHGPGCGRPGPYDRPRRSPPRCCKGMSWESGCSKNKPQNADAEDSGNDGHGRCRQNKPYSSQNKDGNEGNDTVLIQKIVVERVPRSNSV